MGDRKRGKRGKKRLAGILIANAVLLSALDLGRAVDVLQIRTRYNLTYRLFTCAFDGEKSAAYHEQRNPMKGRRRAAACVRETRGSADWWIDWFHISRNCRVLSCLVLWYQRL